MLDSAGHKVQAERCEAFLRISSGAAGQFCEWLITIRFYAALHYVDAFMMTQAPKTWHRHDQRLLKMRDFPETRAIRTAFLRLYELSREARYLGTPFTPADVTQEAEPLFQTVRNAMRSALRLTP